MDYSEEDLAAGKRRLRDLLPWARAELRKMEERAPGVQLTAGNSLGTSSMPHLVEDNALALIISRTSRGGWSADLVLKETPPGFANAIGTPTEFPCATFAEAEAQAKMLLVVLLKASKDNAACPCQAPRPVFMLDNHPIPLNAEVLSARVAARPELYVKVGSDVALSKIADVMHRHLPQGFSNERFQALSDAARLELVVTLHLAAFNDILRYPPRTPGAPPTHAEAAASASH